MKRLLALIVLAGGVASAWGATFTVSNTNDTGAGSLRDAINSVNAACGSGPHSIAFSLTGGGPYTIQPATQLPTLSCAGTTIDGYSQPGSSTNTNTGPGNDTNIQIILNGTSSGGSDGLMLSAANIRVSGLAIRSFNNGIIVQAAGSGAVISGNYIGTDPGGMAAFANATGVRLANSALNVTIGGAAAADRNLITGNIEGISNSAGLGGDLSGLIIRNNQVGGDRGGGTTIGNTGAGIDLFDSSGTTGTILVENNRVLKNGSFGIRGIRNSTIQFNAVHNNTGHGIILGGSAGTTAKGNDIHDNGDGTNGNGISSTGPDAQIESNSIYNHPQKGIDIQDSGVILNNTIFGNNVAGISVSGVAPVRITGTRSYGNNGNVGILADGGVFTNDYSATPPSPPHDDDTTGDGGWQNHPEITSVVQSGGNTTVTGFLRTNGLSENYRIELFSNTVASIRQGEVLEDAFVVSTDANGELTFTRVLSGLKTHITATASREVAPLETSQYSPAVAAVLGAEFSASATTFTFPSTALGLSAPTQLLTITNTGAMTLNTSSLSTSYGGDFSHVTSCGTTIAPAGSCTFTFTFTPTGTGARTGNLFINTDLPSSPHVITLSGTGVAAGLEPAVSFLPSTVAVGVVSTLTITVSNSNTLPALVNPYTRTYPAGLINATTPNVTSSCGGAPTAAPGGGSVGWASAFTVPAGGSCTLSVAVKSLSAATHFLQISSGDLTSSIGINTMTASATLTVTPASALPTVALSLSATNILVGGTTVLQVDVTNANAIAVNNWSFSINYGANVVNAPAPNASANNGLCASNSSLTASPGGNTLSWVTTGAGIGPGETCRILVTLTSAAAGTYTLTLPTSSVNNAIGANAAAASVALTVGLPPATGTLTPGSIAFGSSTVGNASATQTLTLANTSNTTPINISGLTVSGPFAFVAGSTCTTAMPLAPLANCLINIQFVPIAVGPAAGVMTATTDAGTFTATLTGTGASAPVAGLGFNPTSVDFGNVPEGTQSAPQLVTLTNTGGLALSISGITVSGPFAVQLGAPIALMAEPEPEAKSAKAGFTCPSGSFFLGLGSSCTLTVLFSPPAGGVYSSSMVVAHSSGSFVLPLSGIGGVGKRIEVTPAVVTFGSVIFRSTAERDVQIKGTGFDTVALTAVQLIAGAGAAPSELADFSFSHTCGATLPSGGVCNGKIKFRPTALGPRAADLRIAGDFEGGVMRVPVDGIGIPSPVPLLSLSGSSFGFGQLGLGGTRQQMLVIENAGQLPVALNAIYAIGDFPLRHDCPASLPQGARCTIFVTARPAIPGLRVGKLIIESNAVDSPAQIPLEATGCRPFNVRDVRQGLGACAP